MKDKRSNYKYAIFIIFISLILAVFWQILGKKNNAKFDEFCSISNSKASVQFIDVGQGDCVLIASEGMVALIDSGEVDKGNKVVRQLRRSGVKKIDLLVGTHPHSDHIGGFLTVLRQFEVSRILLPDIPESLMPTTSTYYEFLNMVDKKNIPVEVAKFGNFIDFGNGRLNIIGPIENTYDNLNNYSIGLKFVYGHKSFLFCGDMEKEAEKDILCSNQDIKADVFKLSHHGSKTSNTKRFLDSVNATFYVIEVGRHNKYRHPSSSILKRLRNRSVYRTDINGTIVFTTDGTNLKLAAEKGEKI